MSECFLVSESLVVMCHTMTVTGLIDSLCVDNASLCPTSTLAWSTPWLIATILNSRMWAH